MKKILKHTSFLVVACSVLLCVGSCRKEQMVLPENVEQITQPDADSPIIGMYLVNQGNMGSNKASLDYFSFETGQYHHNIYAARNPKVVKELGDVGNALLIHKDKLFVVVNGSNKVEILDAYSAKRIGQIDIPNPRYLASNGDFIYVTSFVGDIETSSNAPLGAVYRIDAATLKIRDKVTVGYQPEEMAIQGQYLYVANSGGYRAPDYDHTLSVIDLGTMQELHKIEVGINPHRVRIDKYGHLWVSTRGNYTNIPAKLQCFEEQETAGTLRLVKEFDIACSALDFKEDRLYYVAVDWNQTTQSNTIDYGVIDIKELKKLPGVSFLPAGLASMIQMPFGIVAHPVKDILFLTDATNYVSSGKLLVLSMQPQLLWSVTTGDIPSEITFLYKRP